MSAEEVNKLCRSLNGLYIALRCLEILTTGIAASAAMDHRVFICLPVAVAVVMMGAPTARESDSQFEDGPVETNLILSRLPT